MTDLLVLAEEISTTLLKKRLMLAVAESCTGGLVSQIITSIPGTSQCFERGFVTYSNLAKVEMLNVHEGTLAQYGAVSEEVAREMVRGAVMHSFAQVGLAITGIAGPSGGTPEKPVGTVCFGWKVQDQSVITATEHFIGDRNAVRIQAAQYALEKLLSILEHVK